MHCRTDISTTVDIHEPLKTIGKTGCRGGFRIFCLTIRTCHECSWHGERHTEIIESCNYWIAAQNNWNWTHVWSKSFPRLRGSSPIFYIMVQLYFVLFPIWCAIGQENNESYRQWLPGESINVYSGNLYFCLLIQCTSFFVFLYIPTVVCTHIYIALYIKGDCCS